MTDIPDNHSPPLRRAFRFAVTVELDVEAYREQMFGPQEVGVQRSLADEIQSNLESLPGVITARAEPA